MEIKSYKKKNGETALVLESTSEKKTEKTSTIKRRGFTYKGKARAALLQLQDDIESGEQIRKEITVEEIAKNGSKIILRQCKKAPISRYLGNFKESHLSSFRQ